MKRMLSVSLLCLIMTSCTNQPVIVSPTATPIPLESTTQSELTIVPYPTYTPVVTATPVYIKSAIQNFNQIVHTIYKEHPGCKSFNDINPQQAVLEFFAITNKEDFEKLFTSEIADSMNRKYRAYLALDFKMQLQNCETGCDPSRIYIEDLATGEMQGINWDGYMPKRITSNLIWIGADILAFQQNINAYNNEIVAIDVVQQIIIYHSLESCN